MQSLEINWRNGDVSIEDIKPKTAIYTHELDGQNIDVVIADGSNEHHQKPTVIWPMAFMARAQDPIEIYRAQILAARLGTKVATVDRPGVRYDPLQQERTQAGPSNIVDVLRAGATGTLEGLSLTQLTALDAALNFEKGEELHLMGYSFGAWSASSMATVLGREPFGSARQPIISGITLIESANDQAYPLNQLRKNLASDSSTDNLSRYLQQNVELGAENALFFDWYSATERSPTGNKVHAALDRKQAFSLYLPALGLRKGFASNLAASAAMGMLQDAKITFARANGSLVARHDAHEATVAHINGARRSGLAAEHIELTQPAGEQPHRHPLMHSMGATAVFANKVVAKLPDMA